MKKVAGRYTFSPTDLCVFMESPFASWMERYHLDHPGELAPDETTEDQQVVMKKGVEHEKQFVERLIKEGRGVIEIPGAGDRFSATLSSVREGA